jgi:hypothetical protein
MAMLLVEELWFLFEESMKCRVVENENAPWFNFECNRHLIEYNGLLMVMQGCPCNLH